MRKHVMTSPADASRAQPSPSVNASSHRPTEEEDRPIVSIVIPCRNEEDFIGDCLDSIVGSRFPLSRLEVLVIDGMSDDGTRRVLEAYARRYPFIRVLENDKRVTPVAFNIGVRHARGGLIMIMSAHATFHPDAIAKAVAFSESSGAENVGGRWRIVPRDTSFLGRSMAATLSHPFGVGNAVYRTAQNSEPRWVDTAAYGCYRREVFDRLGGFNERLVRGQDMEFNLRLKRSGGRTLFVPDVVINYFARSTVRTFGLHAFTNGVWAILPFRYAHGIPVSGRHVVPLLLVSAFVFFPLPAYHRGMLRGRPQ